MGAINTVSGPISPDDLGVTLIHEHLVYGFPGWQCDSAAPPYDRRKIFNKCVEEINRARNCGLNTLVDVTPSDGSRDPELYRMVAEETGVHIICSTGLASEYEGSPNYFRNRVWLTGNPGQVVKDMCESFVKDITTGIGHSGVKAGVIKVGTSKGEITEYEKMVLQAAAMAQKETGAPIVTHTEGSTMGPDQASFLAEQGADVTRLLIGHIDNDSMAYLQGVLQRGAYLGFDRFGLDYFFPDAERVRLIIELVRAGYERQIMLSHDRVMHWPGRETVILEAARPLIVNWRLTHIFENVLPSLQKAGVSDDQIKTIMVDNPRRLLAGG